MFPGRITLAQAYTYTTALYSVGFVKKEVGIGRLKIHGQSLFQPLRGTRSRPVLALPEELTTGEGRGVQMEIFSPQTDYPVTIHLQASVSLKSNHEKWGGQSNFINKYTTKSG